jgi:hypothetical protein
MPVKPEKVGIFITTNIDDKVHELTKSMIHNPLLRTTSQHYSKYPLTTKDTIFMYDELKSKTYEDIVDFFFDPVLMTKRTVNNAGTLTPSSIPLVKKTKNLDKALDDLYKFMNTDLFKKQMSTSVSGTSPNLTNLNSVIQILTSELFIEYNKDLINMYNIIKNAVSRPRTSEESPEYYIQQMLTHRITQLDFNKISPSTKTKITILKVDIMSKINKIKHDVITELSKDGAVENMNNHDVKKKHEQDIANTCLNTNINMMMYRLFPKTNLTASTFISFLVRKIFPMHQTFKYSYLKIDGQVYTIVQYNWLKNVFNHPLYRKLLDGMIKYIEWTAEQSLYAETYEHETTDKMKQLIQLCKGSDIYTNNSTTVAEHDKMLLSIKRSLTNRNGSEEYESAFTILIEILKLLSSTPPAEESVILNKISQFSAYAKARDAINSIAVRPLKLNIEKIFELNAIKNEIELYEERFFRGASIDLKYDFPSRLLSKIDNEPIKRIQKLISDDFLPTQRTSTNYEFQSKFEDYLNNNGTAFIDYIKEVKIKLSTTDNRRPEKDKKCDKCGYAIDEDIDINLNIVQGKEYKYEIYVHFDLIKGEVNDVNRGIMKCPYLNDTLVDNWNNLRKNIIFPFWAPPKLPLFEVKVTETKKGGHRGTRYRRIKHNKTRKPRVSYSLVLIQNPVRAIGRDVLSVPHRIA